MGQGENLRRICERDGPFSRRIKGCQFCVSRLTSEEKEEYMPANMNTKSAIKGTLALLLSSIKKQNPATRRVQAMLGKVNSNKFRLPKVSIV